MTAEDRVRGTLAEPTDSTRDEASPSAEAGHDRLLDAVRALDRATTLSEVLEICERAAGRESERATIRLVRDVSAPAFANDVRDGCEQFAVPLLVAGEVVAVLYAHLDPAPALGTAEWRVVIEVLARHAARCLEALMALKVARFVAGHAEPDAARSAADRAGDAWPLGAEGADEQQAARRYARLLVSEIKLYHEAAIIAGRRERDLASRLGGEIARARSLYEQRVPDEVRRGTDYFRAELVRTLAGGDASLLGAPQREPGRSAG